MLQSIAVGKRPRGIRGSPDGKTVYVALSGSPMGGPNVDESKLPPPDRRHDGIGVIDVATGQLLRVLQGGTDPEQFAVSKDGTKLFIANEDAGLTTVLEVASGKILKQIKVGGEPEGVDLSPDGRVVYVTSEEENQVFAIDTERLELIKAIERRSAPALDRLPPRWFARLRQRGERRVSGHDRHHRVQGDQALDVDARHAASDGRGRVTGRQVRVCHHRPRRHARGHRFREGHRAVVGAGWRAPWGLAVSADGRMVYTANGPSNDVSAVDVATRSVVARTKVGDRPWGLTIVP